MGFRLGMNGKLYYKVGGQAAGGNWLELTNIRDVTLNMDTGEADLTTRGNQGWRATVATLKEASVEFEMVWDTADPGFAAIKDAFFNNSVIGLQILDNDLASGGQGLQADFMVTNFTRNEPLEEGMTVNVTVKVAFSSTPPQWIGG